MCPLSLGGEASGDATGWTCACPSPTRYSPFPVGPSPCVATTYTIDSPGHATGSTSASAQRETPPGEICRTVRAILLRTHAVRRAQRQHVFCVGLLGQSFSGDGKRDGKRGVYPAAGRFTTSAMAEGAIEGTAAMYEVASPHATDFAFSRFDAKPQQADAKPQQPSSSGEAVPMDASAESD